MAAVAFAFGSCWWVAAFPASPRQPVVVGLGEVLWDVFSDRRLLGGAPANFAVASATLGARAIIASRVGADSLGMEAGEILQSRGVSITHMQQSAEQPTGQVQVAVDAKGEPQYTIEEGAAWDFLEFSSELQALASEADAVCFGSLAQRSPASRTAINAFVRATRAPCLRVFDANLRQHYYGRDVLDASLSSGASVLKLGGDEGARVLSAVQPAREPPASDADVASRLLEQYPALQLVCITQGEDGCLVVGDGISLRVQAPQVEVVDAVGAGDTFTAALTCKLLEHRTEREDWLPELIAAEKASAPGSDGPIRASVEFAVRFAAHTCACAGGMPPPPEWLTV